MSHCGPALGLVSASLLLAGCSGSASPTALPPKSAAASVAAARPSTARDFAAGRWIDLTHSFDAATIYWPTEKGFQFEPGKNGPTPKGYYYAANRFTTAEHGGTTDVSSSMFA